MIREDITTVLETDYTLSVLLSGGVHAGTTITRQETPGAFDANGEILPCALVNMETDVPTGPYPQGAWQFVRVFFYQRDGIDVIDQALERTYELLHRQRVGEGTWAVLHSSDVLDREDPALKCRMHQSRYQVVINKE